jgi:DNA-binding transcriptional ArsR family regulator
VQRLPTPDIHAGLFASSPGTLCPAATEESPAIKKPDLDATQMGMNALNHSLRRKIMRWLIRQEEPMSPKELSLQLDNPLPQVSYHVRMLRKYEAISLVRTEPKRGSVAHFYVPRKGFVSSPWVAEVLDLPSASGPGQMHGQHS